MRIFKFLISTYYNAINAVYYFYVDFDMWHTREITQIISTQFNEFSMTWTHLCNQNPDINRMVSGATSSMYERGSKHLSLIYFKLYLAQKY